MAPPAASAVSILRLLRRFRRNRRGAVALEFALVAPVFIALLFAILETGIKFLAGEVLETATQESARMILTGQAQNGSFTTQSQFASHVCNQIPALFTSCNNNISVDIESYPSFSNVTISNPIDSNGNLNTGNFQYSPGNACDIVVVRVFYPWQLFVTSVGYNPMRMSGNKQLLSSTAAFRNEPYSGGACTSG
jgi:Flp pilus assembly protein TadG